MITVDGVDIDLLDADWDILAIVDGCRYDTFKQVYKDIIPRESILKKGQTFCSGTFQWWNNNFCNKDCNDIIYIPCQVKFNIYMPNNSFFKVVNVWKNNWDYIYGTIMPRDMTTVALEEIKKHSNKRFVIHYHQPHAPYIQEKFKGIYTINTPKSIQDGYKENVLGKFYQNYLRRYFGYERTWKWLIRLGIEPLDYYGIIYKLYGKGGLVEGYTENLKLVLREINRLHGTIVVTSDHSYNLDGDARPLKEQHVPWLEIREDKCQN